MSVTTTRVPVLCSMSRTREVNAGIQVQRRPLVRITRSDLESVE